jgi:hypothetical protein
MIGAVSNFSQLPDELTPILLDLSDLSGTDLSGTDELTPILLDTKPQGILNYFGPSSL